MITTSNLEKIKEHVKSGKILNIKSLQQMGFHIGEIAYLIETGRLISLNNGTYEYRNGKQLNILPSTSSRDKYMNTSTVLLSLLLNEEKRIDIDTSDSDWALLEEKSRILESTKGIVILKAMSEERRHKIYKLVKGIPCLMAFPIGTNSEQRQVVLKFHIEEEKNIKNIMRKADRAYQRRNFGQAIKYYLEALTYLRWPSAYIFSKLGLSYMQKHQKKKALLYLTVAEELYKKEGKNITYADLIDNLKDRKSSDAERKKFVEFSEEDFQDSSNYGLETLEEMIAFISSGKKVEEVATMFSLTEEQITLFLLLLARNSYSEGDYKLGDSYIKQVEMRKNKTKQAKQLLDEIRKNKKFYKNRKVEKPKTYSLT